VPVSRALTARRVAPPRRCRRRKHTGSRVRIGTYVAPQPSHLHVRQDAGVSSPGSPRAIATPRAARIASGGCSPAGAQCRPAGQAPCTNSQAWQGPGQWKIWSARREAHSAAHRPEALRLRLGQSRPLGHRPAPHRLVHRRPAQPAGQSAVEPKAGGNSRRKSQGSQTPARIAGSSTAGASGQQNRAQSGASGQSTL